MQVFVYEYLSGGGLVEGDGEAGRTLLPLGRSMRDALAGDLLRAGHAVTVAGSTVDPPAREAHALAGESPFDFVARLAATHDAAWIVAPETGGLLARMQRVIGDARWIGCDAEAIALASSKRATLRRLHDHGIATPIAFDHPGGATRWVVKPDDGAGGVETRLHADHADAVVDAARPGATIEPFVDGEPLSLSLACGARGAELLSINRQRIGQSADGSLRFDGVEVSALPLASQWGRPLRDLARRVVEAVPGLRGFVGIDVVWHAWRGPVVIEVNPRVTCALVGLSAALGRNVAAALLRDWQDVRADAHA